MNPSIWRIILMTPLLIWRGISKLSSPAAASSTHEVRAGESFSEEYTHRYKHVSVGYGRDPLTGDVKWFDE